MAERRDSSLTRFKWIVIAGILALVMILGTIQEIAG